MSAFPEAFSFTVSIGEGHELSQRRGMPELLARHEGQQIFGLPVPFQEFPSTFVFLALSQASTTQAHRIQDATVCAAGRFSQIQPTRFFGRISHSQLCDQDRQHTQPNNCQVSTVQGTSALADFCCLAQIPCATASMQLLQPPRPTQGHSLFLRYICACTYPCKMGLLVPTRVRKG